MPAPTVFWSWQSDLPPRETRAVVRDALSAALDRIAADLEEAERPELDHDTRGVAGSPDIVATILAKIEAAAVFVGDVTPIAVSDGGKHLANPNVLIELGYAKHAIGPGRVVLVWNAAATGARPEDLPFDMRHRRAPLAFSLAEGADREELRRVRADLSRRLEEAIRLSLGTLPGTEPQPPEWSAAEPGEPSLWLGGRGSLVVNQGHLDGSVGMAVDVLPRAYARLVPSGWAPVAAPLSLLDRELPETLGRANGLDFGAVRGGFIVYRSSERIREEGVTPTATRWFRDNGEFWGVASSFFTAGDAHTCLSVGYAVKRWAAWLKRSAGLSPRLGGSAPFHVELGLDGLEGTRWPERAWGRELRIHALEERVRHVALLRDGSDEAVREVVRGAFALVAEAYGLQAPNDEEFAILLR